MNKRLTWYDSIVPSSWLNMYCDNCLTKLEYLSRNTDPFYIYSFLWKPADTGEALRDETHGNVLPWYRRYKHEGGFHQPPFLSITLGGNYIVFIPPHTRAFTCAVVWRFLDLILHPCNCMHPDAGFTARFGKFVFYRINDMELWELNDRKAEKGIEHWSTM